jgi:hypothetical protein
MIGNHRRKNKKGFRKSKAFQEILLLEDYFATVVSTGATVVESVVVSAAAGAGSVTVTVVSAASAFSAFCPQDTTATANPHTNKNAISFFIVYRFKIPPQI